MKDCMIGMLFVLSGGVYAQAKPPLPDAKTIVGKTNAVYIQMKTMQVLLDTETRTGDKVTSTSLTEAKTIASKKAVIRIRPQVRTEGGTSKDVPNSQLLIVDDGRVSWLYQAAQHRYIRRAHVPTAFQTILGGGYALPFGGLNPNVGYKIAPSAVVEGAPAYVLEYMPPNQSGVTVSLYIDKTSYHIRRAKVTRATQPVYSVTTTVRKEVINSPIPDSAFVFVAPKGALEVKETQAAGADPNTIPTTPVLPGSR